MSKQNKVVTLRAMIQGFSDTHCLLHGIESDSSHFRRSHLWIDLKPVKTLEIGFIIELTGNVYYYGKNQIGLNKIRKVKVLNECMD